MNPTLHPLRLARAAEHLDDFEEAMWLTVSGLGDRDTTCAIAASVVVMFTGTETIPVEWRRAERVKSEE